MSFFFINTTRVGKKKSTLVFPHSYEFVGDLFYENTRKKATIPSPSPLPPVMAPKKRIELRRPFSSPSRRSERKLFGVELNSKIGPGGADLDEMKKNFCRKVTTRAVGLFQAGLGRITFRGFYCCNAIIKVECDSDYPIL